MFRWKIHECSHISRSLSANFYVFQVFTIGYKQFPRDDIRCKGVIEFVFWRWAQLQYNNPYVQLVRFMDISVVPFGKAFLGHILPFLWESLFSKTHSAARWHYIC